MLMSIIEKTTIKSYFSSNVLSEIFVSVQTIALNRCELIMKFLHFVGNDPQDIHMGGLQLFKISPILHISNKRLQNTYLLAKNICINESLLLWKGKQDIR
jgi:hypothetical protein